MKVDGTEDSPFSKKHNRKHGRNKGEVLPNHSPTIIKVTQWQREKLHFQTLRDPENHALAQVVPSTSAPTEKNQNRSSRLAALHELLELGDGPFGTPGGARLWRAVAVAW